MMSQIGTVVASALLPFFLVSFFFFNDTATTEIYTLSLHDALPISDRVLPVGQAHGPRRGRLPDPVDRKSTRLNSSHSSISYAVFCLKKKKTKHCKYYYEIKKKNITQRRQITAEE